VRICDFCVWYGGGEKCGVGLNPPKGMGCREYAPGMEKFCSDPGDFVGPSQIVQMATFFGMKGSELKKVRRMAEREERARA
jgi:hypothetical protein